MKYLKIFEEFNSKFDFCREVNAHELDNRTQNHTPESFKKSDTLEILEISTDCTRINESNMPQKFESDDEGMALAKFIKFKENHTQIDFTASEKNQIENILDRSKFECRWFGGINDSESLEIVYEKWTQHHIKNFQSGLNKYAVYISAHEDEWFTIVRINYQWGYTDIYLADQFEQVLEFIKSLD